MRELLRPRMDVSVKIRKSAGLKIYYKRKGVLQSLNVVCKIEVEVIRSAAGVQIGLEDMIEKFFH